MRNIRNTHAERVSTKVSTVTEDEFMECEECSAKAGSPPLCPACSHNRRAIVRMSLRLDAIKKMIKDYPSED